jgi:hypothetical protein
MWTPTKREVKIKIGGVDYTSRLLQSNAPPGSVAGHLTIDNVITTQIDQARFGLFPAKDLDGLKSWQELLITDTGETVKYFGGYVTGLTRTPFVDSDGTDRVALNVDGQDYTCLFPKSLINRAWTGQTDQTIVQEIISYADPDLSPIINTNTYVTSNATIGKFRCSRLTVREALNRLGEIVGADWYVDYDAKLHWFIAEEDTADFDLSDNPDNVSSFGYRGLIKNEPGLDIINRVTVVGGYYRSADTTYILQGTGKDTRVAMPFKAHAPTGYDSIRVWRNDGSDAAPSWTSLTVKTAYINELGGANECLHYFQEHILEQQNNWPNLKSACKVTAQYEIPLRVECRDQASYTEYGRWLNGLINDAGISTKTEARLRGKALLAAHSVAVPIYRLVTYEPGLKAGQKVHIVSAALNMDKYLLIQRVITRTLGTGYIETSINLGAYNPGLLDIIISLKRLTQKDVEWRDDEVLDILLTAYQDLTLDESESLTATQPPYTWGEGGSNDTEWGYGSWS